MLLDLADQKLQVNVEILGSGKPLLLLHGWGMDGHAWDAIAPVLALTHTVCVVNLPGFGKSPAPKEVYGTEDYAKVVKEICQKLTITKPTIIGHSLGGNIAWVFASLYPEFLSKLILVDASGIRRRSVKVRGVQYVAKIANGLFSLPLLNLLHDKARKTLYNTINVHDYETAGVLKETFKKIIEERKTNLLTKITVPTLLIWGENDNDTPVSDGYKFQSAIAKARLVLFAEVGHIPFFERRQDFLRVINTFLQYD